MLLLAGAVSFCCAQGDLPPDVERWVEIRQRAMELLSKVPNYTCVETVARENQGGPAGAIDSDRLRVEIGYVDNKEVYSWPGQKKFSNRELSDMIGHGMTTTGFFAALPNNLFLHNSYSVHFVQKETRQGKQVLRWDFQSRLGEKHWGLISDELKGIAGERGSFWVDDGTSTLVSIFMEATDLPANLPYVRVNAALEYSLAMITGKSVLLPATITIDAAEANGGVRRSRMDFSHCRAFEAESSLSLIPAAKDSAGASTDDAPSPRLHETDSPLRRPTLPIALTVPVMLDEPIEPATAYAGQPIQASTVELIRPKGGDPIPIGSRLHGVVRRVLKMNGATAPDLVSPQGAYLISLEFDTLDTPAGTAQFYGRLVSLTGVAGIQPFLSKKNLRFKEMPKGEYVDEEFHAPTIPGVATFFLTGSDTVIPKGARMIWKIEDLSAAF
jgi:hypothetical protein